MKSLRLAFLGALFFIFLTGCTKTIPLNGAAGSGTYEQEMDIRANGFKRSYLVHIPSHYDGREPLPLVVVLHGAFDTGAGMETSSGFSDLADRENFLVLYPNGMGLFGYLQHWNAGHCCGKAAKDGVDDVGFIEAAIEDVCGRLKVDRQRIFVLGFSNGGMMAGRFAAEKTGLLAGAAFLAASLGGRASKDDPEWRIPEPRTPLPVIFMHGMDDQYVPFEGGVSKARGGARTYWPVMDAVKFWVRSDECRGRPKEIRKYEGRVEVTLWEDCAGRGAVSLYRIKGWAHDWPGTRFTDGLPTENPLRKFEAAEIIWNFFKTHGRGPDIPGR